MPIAGSWDTKSGGKLKVLFGIDMPTLQEKYLQFGDKTNPEDTDTRGLRAYMVSNIPKNSIGAMEWHKNRNELVFALSGKVEWKCEDTQGSVETFTLDESNGVWNPPYILHTYRALDDNCTLLVIANTLFIPDNPETHDSYSQDSFRELQLHGL